MAKAQSIAKLIEANNETHIITVEVIHSDSASYRRSVIPAANRVFDKFMRSPEGKEWISAGYYHFSVSPEYGAVEGGTIVNYLITK